MNIRGFDVCLYSGSQKVHQTFDQGLPNVRSDLKPLGNTIHRTFDKSERMFDVWQNCLITSSFLPSKDSGL